jgi:IclR family transcriptional regulator, acetate operon repressor
MRAQSCLAPAEEGADGLMVTLASGDSSDRSVIGRAFRVIGAFDGEHSELSLATLAERTGLPKPSIHRLAAQLISLGILERTRYGYQLGIALFEFGGLVPRQRRLREIAIPFMEDLYEATHETIHFGVLEETDVIYLERISGRNSVQLPTFSGGRLPAYCSGIGRAMLAYSPPDVIEAVIAKGLRRRTPFTITSPTLWQDVLVKVRASGTSYDMEEGKLGVACVASPVFNTSNEPIAALSIATTTPRLNERLTRAVSVTAASLSQTIQTMPDSYWDRRDRHSVGIAC